MMLVKENPKIKLFINRIVNTIGIPIIDIPNSQIIVLMEMLFIRLVVMAF